MITWNASGIFTLSDRRAKTDAIEVGVLPDGLPLYSYRYLDGRRSAGVMADEVLRRYPDAVGRVGAYQAVDYAKVIQERDLTASWNQMLDSFRAAATLQPWFIVNGAPGSQLLPSHLAAQGFFLLRARTQLREITNILLK